ncbi:MAG: ACP S-malonyltransferase, partial [bacterium]
MKVAALFPGQGSQEVEMGIDFLTGEDQKWFEEVDSRLSFSLLELIENGPAEKLRRTRYTQPALFTVSHLIYRYINRNFSDFNFYAGHSLGEYNALVAGQWVS